MPFTAALAMAVALSVLPSVVGAAAESARESGLTPVVLFPAFHFTKLRVTVQNQTVASHCPRSGSFEDWFPNDHPSTTFSQGCQDKLMTLRVDSDLDDFLDQPGVRVEVLDFGTTHSAPFYETLYRRLESVGYARNRDIRVAGYDAPHARLAWLRAAHQTACGRHVS